MNKIPKIAHFFWNKSPLSYLQYLTITSFNKFNPDWQIIIHESTQIHENIMWSTPENKIIHSGKNYYNNLKELPYVKFNDINFDDIGFSEKLNGVHKSDYLRWWLLSTIGGVWSDFDILYIKPLVELNIPKNIETVICYGPEKHVIGFLMSKENNEFFKKVLENVKYSYNTNDYQCIGSKLLNKTHPNAIIQDNVFNLDMSCFYAYTHHYIHKIFNDIDLSKITDKTVGIHWYNGSSISKLFTNFFDEKNLNTNNIISLLINKYELI